MIPTGWKITRNKDKLFKRITIVSPDGCGAVVDSMDRNPENVLYKLAEALLEEAPDKEDLLYGGCDPSKRKA